MLNSVGHTKGPCSAGLCYCSLPPSSSSSSVSARIRDRGRRVCGATWEICRGRKMGLAGRRQCRVAGGTPLRGHVETTRPTTHGRSLPDSKTSTVSLSQAISYSLLNTHHSPQTCRSHPHTSSIVPIMLDLGHARRRSVDVGGLALALGNGESGHGWGGWDEAEKGETR